MSTFGGFFEAIPGIAVDRFDEKCLQSKFLFLSHCHADHMVGLSKIRNLQKPLFTSEISAVFLKKQFPNISNAIETLEIEIPLEVSYYFEDQKVDLVVTAIPAKHCPGSVMFLFETNTHTILYTGDFRILKSHFHQYEILRRKTIDCVYLDSTFLSERFNEFPTQVESISQICLLIRGWIEKHPENKILIEMPAQYGVEFLFIAIEQKLKQKIYVTQNQWQKYVYLPAMDNCISLDPSKCKIFTKFKKWIGEEHTDKFRTIKPSAMFWNDWNRSKPFVMQLGNKNEYRVAYSNHCSCLELKEFLEFIKPKAVSLNVLPENCKLAYLDCLNRIYPCTQEKCVENEKEETKISFENNLYLPNPTNVKRKSIEVKLPKRLKL